MILEEAYRTVLESTEDAEHKDEEIDGFMSIGISSDDAITMAMDLILKGFTIDEMLHVVNLIRCDTTGYVSKYENTIAGQVKKLFALWYELWRRRPAMKVFQ